MKKLRKYALDMLFNLRTLGVDKAEITIVAESKDETNALGIEEYLLREFDSCSMDIKLFVDNKPAQLTINQFSDEYMRNAARFAVSLAECAQPADNTELTYHGQVGADTPASVERDPVKLYSYFEDMMKTFHKDYPNMLMDGEAFWSERKTLYINTDGTEISFTDHPSYCGWQVGARNETSVTDLVFTSNPIEDYSIPALDCGYSREMLDLCNKMLDPKRLSGDAFSGTLLFQPDSVGGYVFHLLERIADMKEGDGLPYPECSPGVNVFTSISDTKYEKGGEYPFNSKNVKVEWKLKDGKIQPNPLANMNSDEKYAYMLARQKDLKTMPNELTGMMSGDTALDDIIKGIKRGLFIGYISGSNVHANGDFSGAAKNAFYIENGEIKFPVIECMVSGNVYDMFKHIRAVSKEYKVHRGAAFPYVAFDGISIK